MIGRETNHYQIVKDYVTGKKAMDQKTADSAAVLAERLENLKKLGGCFAKIEFSQEMRSMLEEQKDLALC